ncbi:MAG: glutathione peroxidase [Treponemataceae bacterium]
MNFYDFKVKDQNGNDISLEQFKGKVIMIVNTATKCGLTPQYEGLQKLYEKYEGKDFVILDFPCNQFLKQAPGSDEEIQSFCTLNYGTKFPRFAKVDVNGKNCAPLFAWLKEQKPADITDEKSDAFEKRVKAFTLGIKKEDIKWNFGKFLIDKQGNVVARYSPAIPPEAIDAKIAELLA